MPVIGLLQLAIISIYLIVANTSVTNAAAISLLAGSVTLWLSLRFRSRIAIDYAECRKHLSRLVLTITTAFIVLFVIILPLRKGGFLTTPYRIGIDQVGYTETAQFLLKGGTLESSAAEIMQQLDTDDLEYAKQNNARALKFNAYVTSEFLLKALRWGYPAIVANLTFITGNENVVRIAFIGLLLNYGLIFALTYCVSYLPH